MTRSRASRTSTDCIVRTSAQKTITHNLRSTHTRSVFNSNITRICETLALQEWGDGREEDTEHDRGVIPPRHRTQLCISLTIAGPILSQEFTSSDTEVGHDE
jgi:hypothetical protein